MKSTIEVGSIQVGSIQKTRQPANNPVTSKIQQNLKKMKIGNFFEVKGLSTPVEVRNLRASISYFTRRNGIRVETSFKKGTLTVAKTKKMAKTQSPATV